MTRRERCKCAQWIATTVLEVVGLGVLITYTVLTYRLWTESHKATIATNQSAKAATRTFNLSQTPEVEVDSVTFSHRPIEAGGPAPALSVLLTNVGAGTALNMRVICG